MLISMYNTSTMQVKDDGNTENTMIFVNLNGVKNNQRFMRQGSGVGIGGGGVGGQAMIDRNISYRNIGSQLSNQNVFSSSAVQKKVTGKGRG